MRLLLDENIMKTISDYFMKTGIDVLRVDKSHKGIPDKQVLELTLKEKRTIVTLDRKFTYEFKNIEHYGVIWIDTNHKHQLEVMKKVPSVLRDIDLCNKIIKVTKEKCVITYKPKWYKPEVNKIFNFK